MSSRELLLRLFPVSSLLLIAEAVQGSGVERVVFRKQPFGIVALYDAESNTVELDPDADWEALAPRVSRALGLRVEADEAALALLLHEIGHARRRKFLPRLNALFRKLAISDQIEVDEEEKAANEYARERFRRYLWSVGRGKN